MVEVGVEVGVGVEAEAEVARMTGIAHVVTISASAPYPHIQNPDWLESPSRGSIKAG
jgi:hypothetical protein